MNILLPHCIQISLVGMHSEKVYYSCIDKFTDEWFKASDNSDNSIRILFLDFSKAFNLITASLQDREQFVSIGNINSTILKSNAAVLREPLLDQIINN